jgi:hypothetical protein
VLTDPIQRAVYDEIHGYAATATNPFLDDSAPRDHVFVDEFSCIGIDEFALKRNFIWNQFKKAFNYILPTSLQDARTVLMCALRSFKLRKILDGQEFMTSQAT